MRNFVKDQIPHILKLKYLISLIFIDAVKFF